MKTQVTKVAVRREQGVPTGHPARLYVVCPRDGAEITLPPDGGPVTCPNCTQRFDSRGWLIGGNGKQFALQYTPNPQEAEGFDSYFKALLRAHDLIHEGKAFVRLLDSGDLLGVLSRKDFRGRCPKCDPALAASL